jgi:acyl-coenzyme A synthetase/AMP-(fatty) acid ligase
MKWVYYLSDLSNEYSFKKHKFPVTVNSVMYVTFTSGTTCNKNACLIAHGSLNYEVVLNGQHLATWTGVIKSTKG